MGKVFLAAVALAVLGYLGLDQFRTHPLAERELVSGGIEKIKETEDLEPRQEALLGLQLAIMDQVAKKGQPPRGLSELVPLYFDQVPVDPLTGEPFEYERKGGQYNLGAQVGVADDKAIAQDGDSEVDSVMAALAKEGEFINPNTMKLVSLDYVTSGKRDPFLPFSLSKKVDTDIKAHPLTAYSTGQLRVTAILAGADGSFTAIIEDGQGKGFTARAGTKVGNAGGEVIEIVEDRVKILESHVNFKGEEVKNAIEMKLQRGKR